MLQYSKPLEEDLSPNHFFHGALERGGSLGVAARVQALYRVEREAWGLPVAERLALRRERAVPVLAEIADWKEEQDALPKSPLGRALTYLGNQWEALNVYTTAGHLEIDNNPAENALRPVAVGRKNWLFVGPGLRGGRAAAVITSAGAWESIRWPTSPTCSPGSWTIP